MNQIVEIILILLIAVVLLSKPKPLCNFSRSNVGKLTFALIILFLATFNIVYGIVGVFMYVILNEEGRRPSTYSKKSPNDYRKQEFRAKHCKDGKLKDMTPKDVPSIRFPKDVCNPCDTNCEFEISSGLELLTQDEIMRPADSKDVLINMDSKALGGEVPRG